MPNAQKESDSEIQSHPQIKEAERFKLSQNDVET
jgi:hypothetical protein